MKRSRHIWSCTALFLSVPVANGPHNLASAPSRFWQAGRMVISNTAGLGKPTRGNRLQPRDGLCVMVCGCALTLPVVQMVRGSKTTETRLVVVLSLSGFWQSLSSCERRCAESHQWHSRNEQTVGASLRGRPESRQIGAPTEGRPYSLFVSFLTLHGGTILRIVKLCSNYRPVREGFEHHGTGRLFL